MFMVNNIIMIIRYNTLTSSPSSPTLINRDYSELKKEASLGIVALQFILGFVSNQLKLDS